MVVASPAAGVLVAGVQRPVVEATSQRQLRSRTLDKVVEGDRILVAGNRTPGVVIRILAVAGRIQVVEMPEDHNRRGHSRVVRNRVAQILGMVEADRRKGVRRIGDVRRRTVRPGVSDQTTAATCTSTTSGFWRM